MLIAIPEESQHINVLVSGGADSTLLAFLLLKQNPSRDVILHFMRNKKHHTHDLEVMNRIHSWLENYFNKKITLQLWGKTLIRQAVETILIDYPGCVFSGCNKVPEFSFPVTKYIPNDTPPVRGPPFNKFHIRPFIELLKPLLYSIYKKEHILDLYDLTFSCGVPDLIDGRYIPCKRCFFCLERAWGEASNFTLDNI